MNSVKKVLILIFTSFVVSGLQAQGALWHAARRAALVSTRRASVWSRAFGARKNHTSSQKDLRANQDELGVLRGRQLEDRLIRNRLLGVSVVAGVASEPFMGLSEMAFESGYLMGSLVGLPLDLLCGFSVLACVGAGVGAAGITMGMNSRQQRMTWLGKQIKLS